jgi:hypothetical protein
MSIQLSFHDFKAVIFCGADAIIQFLVEKGARMDAKDTFGQTPLSIAQAVITAGLGENADVRPRKFRTSTANVLVKLGAPSLMALPQTMVV